MLGTASSNPFRWFFLWHRQFLRLCLQICCMLCCFSFCSPSLQYCILRTTVRFSRVTPLHLLHSTSQTPPGFSFPMLWSENSPRTVSQSVIGSPLLVPILGIALLCCLTSSILKLLLPTFCFFFFFFKSGLCYSILARSRSHGDLSKYNEILKLQQQ